MTTLEIPPDGIPQDGLFIDGVHQDNVAPLFPDRPSAAALPPQPEVIGLLEHLVELAKQGKLVGLVIIGFDEMSEGSHALVGKCPYATTIGIIEDVKFNLQIEHLGSKVRKG